MSQGCRTAPRPVLAPEAAPVAEIPVQPGVYVLAIRLAGPQTLAAGRLPRRKYQPGTYLYAGSARGGLRARLARHLRAGRRRHWHVDWLLDVGGVAGVWWLETGEQMECTVAARLGMLGLAVPGFGASDCRCAAHLVYAGRRQPAAAFAALSAAFRSCGAPGAVLLRGYR